MNILRLLLSLIAISSTAVSAPLFDIKVIAGKSVTEVQAILGAPGATEKTKHGPKLTFKEETIEIVFIDGKADWITFTPKEAIPFTKQALPAIGIPSTEPTFSNPNVIRWEPCGPYLSVSIFPASGKIDYAYVKVATQ